MGVTRESLVSFLQNGMGVEDDEIGDADPLFTSGLLDSFSMAHLIMFIETEARVRLNPDDITLDNLDTIERILKFVSKATED